MDIPGADAFGRLTREAAAEALGCSPGTLANWAVAGIGPKAFKVRPGRRVYYLAEDVRTFALGGLAA
jgi:helix-turn-helix protein